MNATEWVLYIVVPYVSYSIRLPNFRSEQPRKSKAGSKGQLEFLALCCSNFFY